MSQVDELVAQARAALEAGNRLTARGYWRRAARIAPDRVDIWMDLYRVTDLPQDRKQCLERILELDPDNVEVRGDLARMLEEESAEAKISEPEGGEANAFPRDLPGEEAAVPAESVTLAMRLDITDEMRHQWDEAIRSGKPLVCIDHPHRETALRCNRCGAPVCTSCVVRTPVGFRCKECIKAQQAIFFDAHWYDYPLAALVSLLLSVPAAVAAGMVGWWFALIVSPLAGGMIGGIVHWAIGRRRGQWMWLMVGVCIVLGAVVVLLTKPSAFISIGVYVLIATGAAVSVLRPGKRR
jgi:hypothetical protein